MIVSIENLMRQNDELRRALEQAQTALHHALRDAGAFEHRGAFANCPCPECVAVRVLLGQEMTR